MRFIFALPGLYVGFEGFLYGVDIKTTFIASAYWFSVGLMLIMMDEHFIIIAKFIRENPAHLFSTKILPSLPNNFLSAGFWTKIGTLTATGQGALYAGAFGAVSVIINGVCNVHIHNQTLKAQSAENQKNRTAQADKEAADRTAQANKQQAKYAEQERVRQFERERMQHEKETQKNKPIWCR